MEVLGLYFLALVLSGFADDLSSVDDFPNFNDGSEVQSGSYSTQERSANVDEIDNSEKTGELGKDVEELVLEGKSGYRPPKVYNGPGAKLVPANELLLPYLVAGENPVQCTREGEMYNYWSLNYECYVCACMSNLLPVCASCSGCRAQPVDPLPPPSPIPVPVPKPYEPLLPVPGTHGRVTCSPLPSNKPYENPLNPCQSCICSEVSSFFGKLDIQINCFDNGRCVLPPRPPLPTSTPNPAGPDPLHPFTLRPPLQPSTPSSLLLTPRPDTFLPPPGNLPGPPKHKNPLPGPSPHRSCSPFKPNVPFQHPWDECQICECREYFELGVVNIELHCYTNPICCLTDVVVPLGPGQQTPLNYLVPGQQTPSVTYGPGSASSLAHSTASVNGGSSSADASSNAYVNNLSPGYLPAPYTQGSLPGGNGYTYTATAESGANAFVRPGSYTPGGYLPGYQGVLTDDAELNGLDNGYVGTYFPGNQGQVTSQAEANANAYTSVQNQPGVYSLNDQYPVPFRQNDGLTAAQAEANALVNGVPLGFLPGGSNLGVLSNNNVYPGNTGLQQSYPYAFGGSSVANAKANAKATIGGYKPGYSPTYQAGSALAQAEAEILANAVNAANQASANAQADANANAGGNLGVYQLPYNQGNTEGGGGLNLVGYPPISTYQNPYTQNSLANAHGESLVNVGGGYRPGGYFNVPYYQGGSASAQADASAALNMANGLPGPPGYLPQSPYNQGTSVAEAEALANALVNGGVNQPGYQPLGYLPAQYQGGNSALAEANALANALTQGYMPGGGSYQPYQSYLQGNPTGSGYNSASANAQADASLVGLSQGFYPGSTGGQGSAVASSDASATSNWGGTANAESSANAYSSSDAHAAAHSSAFSNIGKFIKSADAALCKYVGDQYTHACQACYCVEGLGGNLEAYCLGNMCI